jgi:hypothetical protein
MRNKKKHKYKKEKGATRFSFFDKKIEATCHLDRNQTRLPTTIHVCYYFVPSFRPHRFDDHSHQAGRSQGVPAGPQEGTRFQLCPRAVLVGIAGHGCSRCRLRHSKHHTLSQGAR